MKIPADFNYCYEARPNGWENGKIFLSMTIFLSWSVPYKSIDFRDGYFYIEWVRIDINPELLKNLGQTRYFRNKEELLKIQEEYPELLWNEHDQCYYSNYIMFRKAEVL